jgi:hypothetical protein
MEPVFKTGSAPKVPMGVTVNCVVRGHFRMSGDVEMETRVPASRELHARFE